MPVWLQIPVSKGGYGFDTHETVLFSLLHWIGVLLALVYGHLVSDHLPLAVARRFNGGKWKPEYRLHALWVPGLLFSPVGLVIFGYALQNQLSWGIVGLGQIMVTFGCL